MYRSEGEQAMTIPLETQAAKPPLSLAMKRQLISCKTGEEVDGLLSQKIYQQEDVAGKRCGLQDNG